MKRVAGAAAILLILFCSAGPAMADGPARLLGMSNSREAAINRVSFVFDQIPGFEVDQAGQRVRVRLQETGLARTFNPIPQKNLFEPLVRVKIRETKTSSVVDLYFRDVPEFVDVTINKEYSRFQVNVFWDEKRPVKRPGILGRQLGRLRPIKDGAIAEYAVASDYAGDWRRFFKEFEWPVAISLPVHFSLPDFPGPVVRENLHFFPDVLKEKASAGLWPETTERLRGLLQDDAGGRQAVFLRFLLAESWLRRGNPANALSAMESEALETVSSAKAGEAVNAWRTYLRAYALADSGKPYRAARLLKERKETCLSIKNLRPWVHLLQAELNLAIDKPGNALKRLDAFSGSDAEKPDSIPAFQWIYRLRRADALYEQGRLDAALKRYREVPEDLQRIQQQPRSLANLASCLYRKKQYKKAAGRFFLLSEALTEALPDKQAMLKYWSAMARWHGEEGDTARRLFMAIEENHKGSEAAFRSRLKLMDLARLSHSGPDLKTLISDYQDIIETGPVRQVREEAFFKQTLSWHLAGRDLQSVRLLGRFFDDYWGGALLPEAHALLVDVFPEAINTLVSEKAFFEALTLVSKYRDLLAQARITYGFLYNLAESYRQSGFPDQAISTYKYILDFEKKAERKQAAYPPLIQLYHEQEKDAQVLRYSSDYLSRYPQGAARAEILYYYTNVLFEKGERQNLPELLDEKNRPKSLRLDYLAGKVFFERGRYDLAAYYLTWAADADKAGEYPEIRLKLGDVLFADEKWEKAMAVYASLMENPRFAGHAGYRMIQICLKLEQKERALNIYEKMAEKEIDEQWRDLAAETVRIARRQ